MKFPVLKESELEGQVARTVANAMKIRARWENKCDGISLDELVETHYVTKTLRPAVLPALAEVVNSVRAELNLAPQLGIFGSPNVSWLFNVQLREYGGVLTPAALALAASRLKNRLDPKASSGTQSPDCRVHSPTLVAVVEGSRFSEKQLYQSLRNAGLKPGSKPAVEDPRSEPLMRAHLEIMEERAVAATKKQQLELCEAATSSPRCHVGKKKLREWMVATERRFSCSHDLEDGVAALEVTVRGEQRQLCQ